MASLTVTARVTARTRPDFQISIYSLAFKVLKRRSPAALEKPQASTVTSQVGSQVISIPRARNFEIVCLSAMGGRQADKFPTNVWHSSLDRKGVHWLGRHFRSDVRRLPIPAAFQLETPFDRSFMIRSLPIQLTF